MGLAARIIEEEGLEAARTVRRYARRARSGFSRDRAEAYFGGPVIEMILCPWRRKDDRLRPERRATERPRDPSVPVWVSVGRSELRNLFPQGAVVSGPFRATGEGYHREGEGRVDWRMAERWAVPQIGVPVRVTIGNRRSGGYLPIELTVLDESGVYNVH